MGNDGSTDGTRKIQEGLVRDYANLRVVHLQKNGGYGDALFKAIYASKGKYVVTLDSDGQFELSDYHNLLDKRIKNGYDVVIG
jgi:dolichol-phosphate mannosyltransferase